MSCGVGQQLLGVHAVDVSVPRPCRPTFETYGPLVSVPPLSWAKFGMICLIASLLRDLLYSPSVRNDAPRRAHAQASAPRGRAAAEADIGHVQGRRGPSRPWMSATCCVGTAPLGGCLCQVRMPCKSSGARDEKMCRGLRADSRDAMQVQRFKHLVVVGNPHVLGKMSRCGAIRA